MANCNPHPGTRFRPGQSGNPAGRPRSSFTERELARLTRREVAEVFNKILELNGRELQALLGDEQAPVFERSVAAAVLRWARKGSFVEIDRMLDRIIGKAVQQVEIERPLLGACPAPPKVVLRPVVLLETTRGGV